MQLSYMFIRDTISMTINNGTRHFPRSKQWVGRALGVGYVNGVQSSGMHRAHKKVPKAAFLSVFKISPYLA